MGNSPGALLCHLQTGPHVSPLPSVCAPMQYGRHTHAHVHTGKAACVIMRTHAQNMPEAGSFCNQGASLGKQTRKNHITPCACIATLTTLTTTTIIDKHSSTNTISTIIQSPPPGHRIAPSSSKTAAARTRAACL